MYIQIILHMTKVKQKCQHSAIKMTNPTVRHIQIPTSQMLTTRPNRPYIRFSHRSGLSQDALRHSGAGWNVWDFLLFGWVCIITLLSATFVHIPLSEMRTSAHNGDIQEGNTSLARQSRKLNVC